MSTWILILTLGGSGKAIDHIEFEDRTSCREAARIFKDQAVWGTSANAYCVESKHE